MFTIFRIKIFVDFIADEIFLPTKYFQTTVYGESYRAKLISQLSKVIVSHLYIAASCIGKSCGVLGFALPMPTLVYGIIFPSRVSTLSSQYCSYYQMYFLTITSEITSNLCHIHYSTFPPFSDYYTCISSSYTTTLCAGNQLWLLNQLLSACKSSYIRGRLHVALAPFR